MDAYGKYWDSFSDNTKNLMKRSNQISQRLDLECVDTSEMLLAIFEEDNKMQSEYLARLALKSMGFDLDQMAEEFRKGIERGSIEIVTFGRLPLTSQAEGVIERSVGYARELEDNYVGTGHILYGFLDPRIRGDKADVYLRKNGVTEINLDCAIRSAMSYGEGPVEVG